MGHAGQLRWKNVYVWDDQVIFLTNRRLALAGRIQIPPIAPHCGPRFQRQTQALLHIDSASQAGASASRQLGARLVRPGGRAKTEEAASPTASHQRRRGGCFSTLTLAAGKTPAEELRDAAEATEVA